MSFGTSGGRLVVFLAVGVLLAAGLAVAWWLQSTGPLDTEDIQDGLDHPWDLAFTDDGRMVVTERIGRVRLFASGEPDAALLQTVIIPDVRAELESGLMGIAVHDVDVFVCATRGSDADDNLGWRVELLHAVLRPSGGLSAFEPMDIGLIQGAPRHQGCAVEIGPDDHLWLTIGDANQSAMTNRTQDPTILNGKVARLELDGSVPEDAPFESGAVSVGHRNPQGIAFRDGLVVTVEHGTDVNDEINVIQAGANYGYPCVTGFDDTGPIPDACDAGADFAPPAWTSGNVTLATSGATFLAGEHWGPWTGNLVVTTLKEEDLRRFSVGAGGTINMEEVLLDSRFGRLRGAVIGPGGALYISTANGTNDRIVRVTLTDPSRAD